MGLCRGERDLRRLCQLLARGLAPRGGDRFGPAREGPEAVLRSPQSCAGPALGSGAGTGYRRSQGGDRADRTARARQHPAIRTRTRLCASDPRSGLPGRAGDPARNDDRPSFRFSAGPHLDRLLSCRESVRCAGRARAPSDGRPGRTAFCGCGARSHLPLSGARRVPGRGLRVLLRPRQRETIRRALSASWCAKFASTRS